MTNEHCENRIKVSRVSTNQISQKLRIQGYKGLRLSGPWKRENDGNYFMTMIREMRYDSRED